jgi:predicted component of type VI protein secretion system
MPTRLVALTGEADIAVDRSLVLVGRHPLCDVRVRSSRVSRGHCCLTEVDGEVLVRDMGSSNGTLINGRRVEVGRLQPGDELTIAHVRYRLKECLWARAVPADSRVGMSEDSASLTDLPVASLYDES